MVIFHSYVKLPEGKRYSFAADCTCEPTKFWAILNRKDGNDAIFGSDGPVIQVVQTVGLSEVGVPSNIHCFIIISGFPH